MDGVFKQDDFYVRTWITGPTHNYLALKFGVGPLRIEALARSSEMSFYSPVDPDLVRAETLHGIQDANAEFGTNYTVEVLRYVPDDTASYAVYRHLAKLITKARHLDK